MTTFADIVKELHITVTEDEKSTCIADVALADFSPICIRAFHTLHLPLDMMFATDERTTCECYMLHAVFAIDSEQKFLIIRAPIASAHPHFESLTKNIVAAQWYERLIGDQFGIVADGHPDWRRLVHHENIPARTYPMRKDFLCNTKLARAHESYPLHHVDGKGIYEIPVGPIHAGIIEPGHFRFNVRGERILTLEGKLFFTHKGVEKILEGKSPANAMPFIERVSGDMPIGHSIAFVEAVERATKILLPSRAHYLRTFLNEFERVTMHIFDIGNIGGNGTGFTFMAAQGFRIVEKLRRIAVEFTGDRFLRGVIIPGGIKKDITNEELHKVVAELNVIEKDFQKTLDIAYASDGLMERFETTGVLKKEAALAYGAQGVAARASQVNRDARRDHPYAAYQHMTIHVASEPNGDVRSRVDVRVKELKESFDIMRAVVKHIPTSAIVTTLPAEAGSALGWAEAWRGAVLDWVRLDGQGNIDRCVIRDPSFCNWPLFGEIGPGNIVPDFPLCNKSLNLSYSGTDL